MCRRTFTTPTTCFNPRDDHVDTSGVLGWKFQSTHPHGVRRRWREDLRGKRAVSIHAPTQGATFWRSVFCRTPVCFNPRTHTGCDTRALTSANSLPCFNPRTHTGCDAVTKVEKPPARWFQSTHPHGVRHAADALSQLGTLVSIHAPTRGATADTLLGVADCKVSIHAPTRGATRATSDLQRKITCFNPRTHTGCDLGLQQSAVAILTFQSTHPHGVRHKIRIRRSSVSGFNPRTHTGCDLVLWQCTNRQQSFNPRTHTGCDICRE